MLVTFEGHQCVLCVKVAYSVVIIIATYFSLVLNYYSKCCLHKYRSVLVLKLVQCCVDNRFVPLKIITPDCGFVLPISESPLSHNAIFRYDIT